MTQPGKDLHELGKLPPKIRELLWGKWLQTSTLALLFGGRGLGKTYVALDVACAIVRGTYFLGQHGIGGITDVGVADGEMGSLDLYTRIKQTAPGIRPTAIRILSFDQFEDSLLPALSTPRGQAIYDAAFRQCSLIIVDNLLTCDYPAHPRDDEFSRWVRIQQWAIRQREAGKCVLFIHHENKGGMQSGTQQKENVVDTVMRLSQEGLPQDLDGFRAKLSFTKSRHFTFPDTQPLFVERNSNQWVWSSWKDRLAKDVEDMQAAGCKDREICERLRIDGFELKRLKRAIPAAPVGQVNLEEYGL